MVKYQPFKIGKFKSIYYNKDHDYEKSYLFIFPAIEPITN